MRRLRTWAFLWAVLQFALPTGLALVDGRLAVGAVGADVVHVEGHAGDSCHRVHPPDCVVCHGLATLAALDGSPVPGLDASGAAHSRPANGTMAVASGAVSLAFARAPPGRS